MTYEVLQRVSLICGIGSVVMAIVAVVLFFWLDIRSVVGFLTGRTRRKGIDEIRKAAQDGTLDHRTAAKKNGEQAKKNRRKQTDNKPQKITSAQGAASNVGGAGTVITDRLPSKAPAFSDGSEQTTLLGAAAAQTSTLTEEENLTTVLSETFVPGTTLLSGEAPVQSAVFTEQPFEIEFDITYIHSDEVI